MISAVAWTWTWAWTAVEKSVGERFSSVTQEGSEGLEKPDLWYHMREAPNTDPCMWETMHAGKSVPSYEEMAHWMNSERQRAANSRSPDCS